MQALSQLSYGPTLYREPPSIPACSRLWKTKRNPREAVTKRPGKPGLMSLMSGVPTGIRTPVATVKG